MIRPSRRLAALAYGAILLVALIFAVIRLASGGAIATDVQDMLPAGGVDPVVRSAILAAGNATSSHIVLAIGAPDADQAAKAADTIAAALKAQGLLVEDRDDGEATARWLFANRHELLCEVGADRFDAAAGAAVAAESEAMLYAPGAPVSSDLLRRDPFFLTMRLGGCLAPKLGAPPENTVIVSGRLTGSAFRTDIQDKVIATIDAWQATVAGQGVTLARVGAVFHAHEGARTAKHDMSLIGGASMIGIVLLLLVAFRRAAAIPYALMVVAAGAIGSLGASLLLFGSIHVLTLVFGFAFIGVTSDYALYYLATGPVSRWTSPEGRIRLIFRSVSICMATSMIGFACLGAFRIIVFNQMAVFATVGLVSAWGCAFLILPFVERIPTPAKAVRWGALWDDLSLRSLALRPGRVAAWMMLAGLAVLAVLAARHFAIDDDVRTFQTRNPDLVRQERIVHDQTGVDMSPNFLLSWGKDAGEARLHEAEILRKLPPGKTAGIVALSRFDPTPEMRAANKTALRDKLLTPHLADRGALLGLAPGSLVAPAASAALPAWLASLQGKARGRTFLIASLPSTAQNAVRVATIGATHARFVEPATVYTRAFADLRHTASWAVIAAVAMLALMLLAIYRRPAALAILLAPLLGACGGLLASLALDIPISFFSIMGLFVIFGTGMDYSILQWESGRGGGTRQPNLPVLITAASGILSLGTLGLSSSYPVRAFGVVVAIGLFIAYYLAAMCVEWGQGKHEDRN
jgi:predicted exporter